MAHPNSPTSHDFWALRAFAPDGAADSSRARLVQMPLDQLTEGDVTIEVHYSGINFKDALAATGKGKILKRFPLNVGIDASGVVLESSSPEFVPGQHVLINGEGTGETYDGGMAERVRVHSASLLALPAGLDLREAMILGTAGFTAALALHRMLENHQSPDMGPILVTGASGGVGSCAVQLFSHAGFTVHAVSGKAEAIPYLTALGATHVVSPADLQMGARPLESVRFGGVVDNVGGTLLSRALAHTQLWGNVCSIGLADSHELHATVMPHILRGVSLLGISSNNCPHALRAEIWQKLGAEWKPKALEQIVNRTVRLADALSACDDLMGRRAMGRTLVEVRTGM